MAIGMVFNVPGTTAAQYDQVRKELHPDNKRPAGMLYHAAGPTANGWRVVEVWESQEAADRYFQEKLGAALTKANISAQPDVFQIYNVMEA